MMKFCSLILLLVNVAVASTAKLKPLVILPDTLKWNTNNTIIVTSNPNAYSSRVDIKGQLVGSNGSFSIDSASILQFGKQNVNAGEPITLIVNVKNRFDFYAISVSVTGHADFNATVRGAPNIESVFLQSDKTFYRSNETVKLRTLPLTVNGNIFHGKLRYILQDPNGFEIRSLTEKTGNHFVDISFDLPLHLRYGKWKVVARAQKSDRDLGEVAFRVEDYVLPKFHVNVQVDDHNRPLYTVKVSVLAKFPRGNKVDGDLLLYCSMATERNASSSGSNAQASKRILLLSSKIEKGNWSQELSIRQCVTDSNTRVEILAEVHEASTFKAEFGSTFYEVLKPGFEVIPARPAVLRSSKKIVLYVRPLTDDVSIKESEIFVKFHCPSSRMDTNGVVRTFSSYKLGDFLALDFDVNPNCAVHLYQISRKLTDSTFTKEEIVAIPTLDDTSALRSWLESSNPAKILYYEGDVFEAQVSGVRDSNYVVLCDSKRIIASGKVPDSNTISVPIQNGMKGICMLYVYKIENPKTKLDMLMFMAESGSCPSDYQISVSSTNIAVNKEITLKVNAVNNALGLVRAMDSRLEKMFHIETNLKRHYVFNFAEFNSDADKTKSAAILNGFVDVQGLMIEIDNACASAGRYIPSLSPLRYPAGSSMVSNLCVTRMLSMLIERSRHHINPVSTLVEEPQTTPKPKILVSGFFSGRQSAPNQRIVQPQNLMQKSAPAFDDTAINKAHENSELMPTSEYDSDELFLRDFFPEVWLFKEFSIGQSGFVEEKLLAPHSVAEWSFVSHFWAPSRRNVCKLPSVTVFTSRHLYIDVDLPRHVYENETVEFKLSVNADQKLEKQLSLALCIRGFSPLSCADLGPEGKADENDYFGFTMDTDNLKVEKSFFVRYLRDGAYDLQFELLDRSTLLNTRWKCDNTGYAHIEDKVKHTIHVSKRLDLDEHFRQVVVHRQRQPTNEYSLPRVTNMISLPDVIQFKDTAFENGTSVLTAEITSSEKIYDIAMEFSEFTPSVPLRDLNSFVIMRNSPRRRRQAIMGSLSDVIGDLSLVTFQSKPKVSLQSNDDDLETNQQHDITVGNLMSELLTYSDCQSANEPTACGFGEYGMPSTPETRDIVLTSLATTLLCEQSAAEQFICGPIKYLAEVIPRTSTSSSSFLEFLQFNEDRNSAETFMRALLSWVGKECSAYTCVQKHDVWKNFLAREYRDNIDSKDLRIEAALAHLLPVGSASLVRQKLSERANPATLPFWSVKIKKSSLHQSLLDTSIQRSADILLNSLAMLTYTKNPDVYAFWRDRFDFDALAEWLTAQQDGRQQFENALDTYFGLKALHAYRKCQSVTASNDQIAVNVSAANQNLRTFNQDDLPLKLGIPTNATNLQVVASGDLRMILGVRVLTEKRRRSKRDPSENFPVSIKITQQRQGSTSFFIQKVTIVSHSSLLSKLEIEHGLMTGFYSDPSWIKLTSKGVSFLIGPRVHSYAINFVISGLQKDKEFSYEVRMGEPLTAYNLEFLAPFLITARHHVVVGQQVFFPKDLDFSQAEDFSRRKRFLPMSQHLQQTNLIETVCVENGACTCAEGTCDVTCQSCGYVKVENLCKEFKRPFGFAMTFKLLNHHEVVLGGNTFDVFDVRVFETFGVEEMQGPFSLWIRACNTLCKRATRDSKNSRFLLIGRSDGIFYSPITQTNTTDTSSLHRHYLMRNEDRLAKASDCWELFSKFQESECITEKELL